MTTEPEGRMQSSDEVTVSQVEESLPLRGGKTRIHEDGSVYEYFEEDFEEVHGEIGFAAVPQGDT